jgi:hypothetical protein
MNDKRDFDRAVDRWLDDGSDATPPEVINAVLLAVRSTPQERDFRVPWRNTAMASYLRPAAVIALAVIASTAAIFTFGLGGSGIGQTGATPSPSPVLLARGSFVEHDWGLVEFEAIREGSSVTGRMTLAERDDGFGPITVDLLCTRETDDGIVMIGGYVTVGNQFIVPGTPGWVAVERGSPDKASVNFGSPMGVPATQTTDCRANLDAWLQHYRRGGYTLPLSVLDGGVEFGP